MYACAVFQSIHLTKKRYFRHTLQARREGLFVHVLKKYMIFTFSSHTEYVERESIVIARTKKKIFICPEQISKRSEKKTISVCLSVRPFR